MSNLGLAILYDLLNQREDMLAERVYVPWPDMETKMKAIDMPLPNECHATKRWYDAFSARLSASA